MIKETARLMIVPFPCLPSASGGQVRVFHTIKALAKKSQLTVWNFLALGEVAASEKNWFKIIGVNWHHFSLQKKTKLSFWRLGQPYWFAQWYNEEIIKELRSQASKFVSVQIESSQLLYLVEHLPKTVQKIFVAYDVSSVSFWRRLEAESSWLKKAAHFLRFLEVYFYEKKWLKKFDLVIAVSKHDQELLEKHFQVKKTVVLANGIDKVSFLPTLVNKKLKFGYLGSFAHPPNLEAVKYLLNYLLPELERQGIEYEFYLAGANDANLTGSLCKSAPLKDRSNIRNLGFLENVEEFYQQVDLLVAPIFAGSGTRIKILESLSYGRPVLTTLVGAEGLEIISPYMQIMAKANERDPKIWVEEMLKLKDSSGMLEQRKNELKNQLGAISWEKVFENNYL